VKEGTPGTRPPAEHSAAGNWRGKRWRRRKSRRRRKGAEEDLEETGCQGKLEVEKGGNLETLNAEEG
jgi:hypothetical protein